MRSCHPLPHGDIAAAAFLRAMIPAAIERRPAAASPLRLYTAIGALTRRRHRSDSTFAWFALRAIPKSQSGRKKLSFGKFSFYPHAGCPLGSTSIFSRPGEM